MTSPPGVASPGRWPVGLFLFEDSHDHAGIYRR